ncbi:MAG: hypothetical protein PWP54_174 [Thermosipho sp. (in: thermotogales)]|nr:hypothetical protein [Thermosipho sp. (in: thermotogales)]MDN5324551.1 hypothetical protein [Thermosipho sp. (in: thermotogales)]
MKRGFTLIELLIVLAIISALMGIATPVGLTALKKAKATQIAANLRNISEAVLTAFLTYNSDYFSAIDNNNEITEENKAKLRIKKLYQDGFIDKDLSESGYEILLSEGGKSYKICYVNKDIEFLLVRSSNPSVKLDENTGYICLEVPKP